MKEMINATFIDISTADNKVSYIKQELEKRGYVLDWHPSDLHDSTFMGVYPLDKTFTIYCHTYIKREHDNKELYSPEEFINKFIKENNMKTKTVKLTLEQARELYNQGGNFKTIALGAYSEKELTEPNLPNSWGEFCKNYHVKRGEAWIDSFGQIETYDNPFSRRDPNNLPNKETAEAVLALCQLIQLRDCYNQGWKPDWTNHEPKHIIRVWKDEFDCDDYDNAAFVMAFKTEELRNKFFTNFKDLLEQAKELL